MGLNITATLMPFAEQDSAPSAGAGMLPFLIIAVAFLGFMMYSNRRRQKKAQERLAELQAGDKVMLQGGLHATIVQIGATESQVEIAPGVIVSCAPGAVQGKLPEPTVADITGDQLDESTDEDTETP